MIIYNLFLFFKTRKNLSTLKPHSEILHGTRRITAVAILAAEILKKKRTATFEPTTFGFRGRLPLGSLVWLRSCFGVKVKHYSGLCNILGHVHPSPPCTDCELLCLLMNWFWRKVKIDTVVLFGVIFCSSLVGQFLLLNFGKLWSLGYRKLPNFR